MPNRPRIVPTIGEVLADVQALPRESVPAIIVALVALLAEPQPPAEPPPIPEMPRAVEEADRLLTAEEVGLRLGLDVAAVARRRFPFKVKLGHRTVRYSEAGLAEWMRKEGH